MDVEVARWLVSDDAAPWLELAGREPEPSSLAAASRWRRGLPPERASAVLDQAVGRRRARGKLGAWADHVFVTRTGLEMATRADVARWRAARLAAAGVTRLIDAGTGLGIDALAGVLAGLDVEAIERDPVTAVLARANLDWAAGSRAATVRLDGASGGTAGVGSGSAAAGSGAAGPSGTPAAAPMPTVRVDRREVTDPIEPAALRTPTVCVDCQDVTDLIEPAALRTPTVCVDCREVTDLVTLAPAPGEALFVDPSRRTDAGPTWDIHRLTPAWEQVRHVLTTPTDRDGIVVAKLAPGMAHRHIPATVAATWVSHAGDLVELSLWRGPWSPQPWTAVLLPGGERLAAGRPPPPPGPLGACLYEPDPGVIRAGAVGELAERLGAHPVAEHIAYLTGDQPLVTPFARRFDVLETLPYHDKTVRAWLRAHRVGVVEIKTRGLDLDPSQWRRRLAPSGPNQATLVATPTVTGAAVLVVRRA